MIEPTRYTGSQSACAEYAEGILSLDQKFLRNPPATIPVRVSSNSSFLQLKAGDYILIDRSLYPKPHELIVAIIHNQHVFGRYEIRNGIGYAALENGRSYRLGDYEGNEDCLFGVASILIRDFVEIRSRKGNA